MYRVADCIVWHVIPKATKRMIGSSEMPSGIHPGHNCNEDKNHDSNCEKNKKSLSFAKTFVFLTHWHRSRTASRSKSSLTGGIRQRVERAEANHHMPQRQLSASKSTISDLTKPHHIATPRPAASSAYALRPRRRDAVQTESVMIPSPLGLPSSPLP